MSDAPEIELIDPPDEYDNEIVLEPAADAAFERALKLRRRVKAPPKPPDESTMVVLSNGTNIMGRPVPMLPGSDMAVMNNMICREELYPSGPIPPPSPTITGLKDVMHAIATGTDLTPFKENIERVTSNQPEKGEVVNAYLKQADKEVLVKMVAMRDRAVTIIEHVSARTDMTVSEALVVWKMTSDQIPGLSKNVGTEKPVDRAHVIEKIDYSKATVERDVRRRWEGTTPQGRELIRKKLWEVKREVLAEQGVMPTGILPVEPTEPPEEETAPFETSANPPPVTLAQPK